MSKRVSRWPLVKGALVALLLPLTGAGCQRSSAPRAVIGHAQVASSGGELPRDVGYLNMSDICAATLVAHGGTASPQWMRSDRDFDGDGTLDVAMADRGACDALGNCHWQLYKAASGAGASCPAFVGELAGASLAVVENDEPPMRLQGIWRLSATRVIRHEYRWRHGRYELESAAVCALGDGAIFCGGQ